MAGNRPISTIASIQRFSFTGIPTVLTPTGPEDVIEYVDQFIDNELINIIITETNRYARYQNISLWTADNEVMRVFMNAILL